MMPNKRFGDLLSEGVSSVAKRQGKKVVFVEEEIGLALGYTSHHNVERWRKGFVPKEPEQVAFLVRYCVTQGRVGREWAQSLLTQARYPQPEALLQGLFSEQPTRTEAPRVYHNLPPRYGDFLGREADVTRVLEGLRSRWPLVSIEGLGGIGKTTLAVEAARLCLPGPCAALDPAFEAVVWVSAKDRLEQKEWLSDVLDATARVLDYPFVTQLPLAQKPAEVDKLLRTYRTLVVIDNFETIDDADLVAFIQSVPEPSKVLITSRHSQLRSIWPIHLRGLAEPEALDLIRRQARRLGLTRVEVADEGKLLPLAAVTEGNPKAIELALGYVKRGALSLEEVVDHLHTASREVGDIFDDLLTQSWNAMSDDAQRLALVMPFFVGAASKPALAAAADLTGYRLDMAIEQLVEMFWLDPSDELTRQQRRYSAHPLVLAFALARLKEQPLLEEEARRRWCDYFIGYATEHLTRDNPEERYWNALTTGEALEAIDPEWPNLLSVVVWTDERGEDYLLVEMMMLLAHYMDRRALYAQRTCYIKKAAAAANRLGQAVDEALFRLDGLGWSLMEVGRFREAECEIRAGLRIAHALDAESDDAKDLVALGSAFLGRVFLLQEDTEGAERFIAQAMAVQDRRPVVRYRVLTRAGELAQRQGNYTRALELHQAALQVAQTYSNEEGWVDELHNYLADAYLAANELDKAEIEFSVPMRTRDKGVTIEAIYAKYGQARVARARGEKDRARILAREAFNTLISLHSAHRLERKLEVLVAELEGSIASGDEHES